VVHSKTGSKLELLPYLQPTIVILHQALLEAIQKKADPSLKLQLNYLAEMIESPNSKSLPEDHGIKTSQ
jgi:hypothetical protein